MPGSWCLPPAPAEAGALGLLRVLPVRGSAMQSSLAGPSGVGLALRALRCFGMCGPNNSRVQFLVPSVVRQGTRLVHRGCFVWTLTYLPLGRRTRCPGPVRVRLLLVAGSSGPASRAVVGAPGLTFGRFVLLLCSALSRLGLPLSCPFVCLLSYLFFLFFFPAVSRFLLFLAFGAVGLGTLCFLLPHPCLTAFFLIARPHFLWPSLVSGPGCLGPWRCAVSFLPPLSFFAPGFRFWASAPIVCCWFSPALVFLLCFPPLFFSVFGFLPPLELGVCSAGLLNSPPISPALPRPALRCVVLSCSGLCRCLLYPDLWRCPSLWGPVPSGGLFCVAPHAVCSVPGMFCLGLMMRAVVRRCALCCVRPGVSCCAFPVPSALCDAALRCAGAVASCCFFLSVLFLVPSAVVRCCLLCGFLWCCAVLLHAVPCCPVACCVVLRPSALAGWLPCCVVRVAVPPCSFLVPCSAVLCPVAPCFRVLLSRPVLLPC